MAGGGSARASDTIEEVLARLAAEPADIVVVGEIHDNPRHHEIQARVSAALQPGAIVFEMIDEDRTELVNRLRAEGADRETIRDALDWDETGWPDFDHYAPIMEAAPDAEIRGAGQSRDAIRKAAQEGAASVFAAEAARYGLATPLPEALAEALREEMAAAHCNALPVEALDGMIEVQRLRDAALARAAVEAREDPAVAGPVLMIAGNGHADRLRGAPAAIAAADPDARILILGQTETDAAPGREYDMVIASDAPPDRADPCAVFEARDTDTSD